MSPIWFHIPSCSFTIGASHRPFILLLTSLIEIWVHDLLCKEGFPWIFDSFIHLCPPSLLPSSVKPSLSLPSKYSPSPFSTIAHFLLLLHFIVCKYFFDWLSSHQAIGGQFFSLTTAQPVTGTRYKTDEWKVNKWMSHLYKLLPTLESVGIFTLFYHFCHAF